MPIAIIEQVKQVLRRHQMFRNLYNSLLQSSRSLRTWSSVKKYVWMGWIDEMASGLARPPTRNFSLEFTITGRNDDYEPNWSQRLESVLRYNRTLFDSTLVDFRVAFVEWNPPEDRPLLSQTLVERFDFVRAIVVSADIHRELVRSPGLNMMLNYGLNTAIRTSNSDFILISGADVFLGLDVARWLARKGLRYGYLYRATRVDVRNDLDFAHPRTEALEDPRNVVRVCESSKPPYTNACGDFILMDRASFHKIRGYDETLPYGRLHLDGRCCLSAMDLGLRCRLIGHVYHIDHSRSYANLKSLYVEQPYDYTVDIPYQNPETWGLQDRTWVKVQDRLYYVS
jgi:hypothetical protein